MAATGDFNSVTPGNPFRGPSPYQEGDRLYGRGQDAANLADMLVSERILLLYSSSGAGKTSLINARLVPEMRNRGFQVLGPARPAAPEREDIPIPMEGSRFIFNVLSTLEQLSLKSEEQADEEHIPDADLAQIPLDSYLGERSHILDDTHPKLLILDQFEELLNTEAINSGKTEQFFVQLGRALADKRFWLLVSMREEYLAALDPYLDWLPTSLSNRFRLELLVRPRWLTLLPRPLTSGA